MYDANIYEIVSMYVAAIKESGITGKPEDLDADRTKIRDYMTNLKGFEGFGGPIGFNADGDAAKDFFIVQGQNGAWATKDTRLQRRRQLLIGPCGHAPARLTGGLHARRRLSRPHRL